MDQQSDFGKTKAAAYPRTSASETISRDIFYSLIDRKFIKGEINVLDKIPNSDGILDITDDELVSTGKIEVQLKTLAPENWQQPKFQCSKNFLAFCRDNYLPVLLIGVDQNSKRAYWKHIDQETIADAASRITGESITISFHSENLLDGSNHNYLTSWKAIIESVKFKVQNFDSVIQQRNTLRDSLDILNKKLTPAVTLSESDVAEIHNFIDHYNYILDKEFKVVKDARYHSYWKIGIGILSYTQKSVYFFMFPIEQSRNEPLIKQVKSAESLSLEKLFFDDNALFLVGPATRNLIREAPIDYAYYLIHRDAMKVIGKMNLPLDDVFIANEYLWSFANSFHAYFGLVKEAETYDLAKLQHLIFVILPIAIESNLSIAEHVTELYYSIDQFKDRQQEHHYLKRIGEAILKIESGYKPRVIVRLSSETFNIKLVNYFIRYLQGKQQKSIVRSYVPMKLARKPKSHYWDCWDKDGIFSNLRVFFDNFYRIYKSCILKNFRYLQHETELFEKADSLIYVLRFREDLSQKPMLFRYKLRSQSPKEFRVLLFMEEDPKCPVSVDTIHNYDFPQCQIEDTTYQVASLATMPLDFLFEISPTYYMLNTILQDKVEKFFEQKKKNIDRIEGLVI